MQFGTISSSSSTSYLQLSSESSAAVEFRDVFLTCKLRASKHNKWSYFNLRLFGLAPLLHIQQLLFTSLWAVICTVWCQLSNGTNYQKEEYGKISRKYWVVLCECVVSARHLTSSRCIAHSARQFWAILPSFFNKMVADASDFGKNGIDWSFRSSKPVEKV